MTRNSSADLSTLRIDHERRRPGGGPPAWLMAVIGVALAGGIFIFRDALFARPVTVRVTRAARLEAAPGGPAPNVEILTANGYVVPRRKASVSSEIGGRLAALYVEEGDTAAAGQILGVLRNDDQKAQVDAARADLAARRADETRAKAQLARARQDFDRQTDLLGRGLASPETHETAEAELHVREAELTSATAAIGSAEARVRVAQENLEKTFIRAPFAGTVLRKEAEVGEIVTPLPASGGLTRGAIVTMADLRSSEMEVDVNEGYITRVGPDQKAEIELDAYAGVRFPAHVRQVVPTADRQKATVQVKVSFDAPDPRILPEMGGKVYFLGGEPAGGTGPEPGFAVAVLVPKAALRQFEGRSIVFVVTEDRVKRQPVEPAGPVGDQVKIAAGLSGGETVVVEGPDSLKDGDRVRIEGGVNG